jgi:hypothetical protein
MLMKMQKLVSGFVAATLMGCAGTQTVGGTTSAAQQQLNAVVAAIDAYCTVAAAKRDIDIAEVCASAQQYAPITLAAANAVLDTIELLFQRKMHATKEAECGH